VKKTLDSLVVGVDGIDASVVVPHKFIHANPLFKILRLEWGV
jgi:hypothetical protein